MKENFEVIKYEDKKAELAISSNKSALFVDEKYNDSLEKFNNFECIKYHNKTMLIGNHDSLSMVAMLINDFDYCLEEILLYINKAFSFNESDFLKFKEDLGELIFLYKIGGKKIMDDLSTNIIYDHEVYDIKTFTFQANEITMTLWQLSADTKKIAIKLNPSNNGMSIIELANLIDGHKEFKIYILDKSKHSPFALIEWQVLLPIDITDIIKNIQAKSKFHKSIMSAGLKIKINYDLS